MSYSDEEDAVSEEEEEETEEEKAVKEMVTACKYGYVNNLYIAVPEKLGVVVWSAPYFKFLCRNLIKAKELVEKQDEDFVQKHDGEGHTFVHWAALGGYNELIEFLLEKGAPLNEHSDNDYGPRPIHWACVHGNITTVDLFVEKGVPIDTTDLNGCSALLVAAQYGQSLAVSYLLQKGANKFHVDINGDSALHWASFKGILDWLVDLYSDTCAIGLIHMVCLHTYVIFYDLMY